MSEFEDYYSKHFKINNDGELKHIRSGCFGGNGLMEPVCRDNLEALYNLGQARNKELEDLQNQLGHAKMSYRSNQAAAAMSAVLSDKNRTLERELSNCRKNLCESVVKECKCEANSHVNHQCINDNLRMRKMLFCKYSHGITIDISSMCTKCGWFEREWTKLDERTPAEEKI